MSTTRTRGGEKEVKDKIKWNYCKECGVQYGLHSEELGHLFVGLPYEGYGSREKEVAPKSKLKV